jgi:hypothetical protein
LLTDFVALMKPFEEATNCVQGEGRVTVSSVIPSIRGLKHKLIVFQSQSQYCKPLATELLSAINRRLPTYEVHPLYTTGAVFDPRFKLQWCQLEEIEQIKGINVLEIQKRVTSRVASVVAESHAELIMQQTAMEPPAKKAKLFSFMDHPPQPTQIDHDDTFLNTCLEKLKKEIITIIRKHW